MEKMNIRPLLLSHQPTAVIRPETRYIFEKYFNIEEYQPGQQYDPANTLVVVPHWNAEPWCHQLYSQGFRMVIDNLWEPHNAWKNHKQYRSWDVDRIYVIENPNWFWYYESTRLVYTKFQHVFNPTYKNLALMPMRLTKHHRTRLFKAMQPWLHDCYWSYLGEGHHFLPGDEDTNKWSTQRYVNTDWYDHTCFSIVAETFDDAATNHQFGELAKPYQGPWPFVSEKTFKPIQYQHPFMVYGQQNTLKFLHDLGFETFENLFDESYDTINSSTIEGIESDNKLQIIINNVKNFSKHPRDQLTQQKIQHNHAHFSDLALVESRFIKEIVEPVLEFLG